MGAEREGRMSEKFGEGEVQCLSPARHGRNTRNISVFGKKKLPQNRNEQKKAFQKFQKPLSVTTSEGMVRRQDVAHEVQHTDFSVIPNQVYLHQEDLPGTPSPTPAFKDSARSECPR